MTEGQIIDICTFFSDEMNNGGFLQLLYNDSRSWLKRIPECLTDIGIPEMADICQDALSVFSDSLPDDLEQRRAFLAESVTPEIIRHLENCDARFNKASDRLEEILGRFIDQHFPDDPVPVDRKTSKDYVALFRKLEERKASTWDDFADPKVRRQSNKAGTEIHKLKMELFSKPDKGAPVILKLLQDKDPRVRVTGGSYCLQAQIHEDLGRSVLAQIAEDLDLDKMIRFEAKCCIEYCRPFNMP